MKLPLFPLNSVLFPGAPLPPHIFEERYQQLIGRCIQATPRLGVLLIRPLGLLPQERRVSAWVERRVKRERSAAAPPAEP